MGSLQKGREPEGFFRTGGVTQPEPPPRRNPRPLTLPWVQPVKKKNLQAGGSGGNAEGPWPEGDVLEVSVAERAAEDQHRGTPVPAADWPHLLPPPPPLPTKGWSVSQMLSCCWQLGPTRPSPGAKATRAGSKPGQQVTGHVSVCVYVCSDSASTPIKEESELLY